MVESGTSGSNTSAAHQRQQEDEQEALLQRSLVADRVFLAGFAGIDDVGPSSHVRLAHAAACLLSHYSPDNPEWYFSLPLMLSAPGYSIRPLLTRLTSLFQADKFTELGSANELGREQARLAFQSRELLRRANLSLARAEARQASSSSSPPACFSRRPRRPARSLPPTLPPFA